MPPSPMYSTDSNPGITGSCGLATSSAGVSCSTIMGVCRKAWRLKSILYASRCRTVRANFERAEKRCHCRVDVRSRDMNSARRRTSSPIASADFRRTRNQPIRKRDRRSHHDRRIRQASECLPHAFDTEFVEIGQWLVKEQQLRTQHARASNRDPAAFSTGQAIHISVRQFRDAELVHDFVRKSPTRGSLHRSRRQTVHHVA